MSNDQAPTGTTAGHVQGRVHGQAHRAGYDEETRARLASESAQIMARYPQQRSALLPMLHLVQAEDRYVSPRGIAFCAQQAGISTAEVSAVATFYTQYKRHPNGDYTVGVCTNTLCAVMGGDAIWEEAHRAPRRRARRDDGRRRDHARAHRVQRGLRLRTCGDGQLGVLRQPDAGLRRRAWSTRSRPAARCTRPVVPTPWCRSAR